VIGIAKKYANYGIPWADLIQEGNIGLLIAVKRFNLSKSFRFSTYAGWWIRKMILKAVACEIDTKKQEVGVADPEDLEKVVDPDETISIPDLKHIISTMLDTKTAEILNLRYGLTDGRPMSLEEVGRAVGMSRETVRQRINTALKTLSKTVIGESHKRIEDCPLTSYTFWRDTLQAQYLWEDLTPDMWKEFEQFVTTMATTSGSIDQSAVDELLRKFSVASKFSSGGVVVSASDRDRAFAIVTTVLKKYNPSSTTKYGIAAFLYKCLSFVKKYGFKIGFASFVALLAALVQATVSFHITPNIEPAEPKEPDITPEALNLVGNNAGRLQGDITLLNLNSDNLVLNSQEANKGFTTILSNVPRHPNGELNFGKLPPDVADQVQNWVHGTYATRVEVVIQLYELGKLGQYSVENSPISKGTLDLFLYNNDGTVIKKIEIPVSTEDYTKNGGVIRGIFDIETRGLPKIHINGETSGEPKLLWRMAGSQETVGSGRTDFDKILERGIPTSEGPNKEIHIKQIVIHPHPHLVRH
jgi:RNA polymerase sigma factor (sigma-70 family)